MIDYGVTQNMYSGARATPISVYAPGFVALERPPTITPSILGSIAQMSTPNYGRGSSVSNQYLGSSLPLKTDNLAYMVRDQNDVVVEKLTQAETRIIPIDDIVMQALAEPKVVPMQNIKVA